MITYAEAHELFEYKNGNLFRKTSRGNSKKGSLITRADKRGYISVKLNKKDYGIHRIIYLMFFNKMPYKVDHIDGNPSNNCIENLRPANSNQNGYNSKLSKSNTTGFKNVHWNKIKQKWAVRLMVENKSKHIGYFDNLELADLIATEARNKYHKEFARHA
jgi:hypothetical protein